ncbi:SDR family oxidoreductase [Ruegeria atlantica]|uniref:SDR family oxidoreductase n=1 Tax=Ruegeria atlantica TaxID=81569 RepID=UPI0014814948|nr:SDR family oxidoreductase [Ruegeria atlantica]
MTRTALIIGATGLSGSNLAARLSQSGGWHVYGLSRGGKDVPGVDMPLAADLTDETKSVALLSELTDVTHVFFCTWSRQETEAENCRVNRAMVRNTLTGLKNSPLKHVALVTGTKHYLGPFEAYAQGRPYTPFLEDQPRLPGENFYYEQEDEIFDAAEKRGFTWSVHRPHTMIGYTLGNAMNMAVTLAVYASICAETGRPFLFPGSKAQYHAVADITDARLLAQHLEWSATTPVAANTAYNVVNGDLFRWEWMWGRIADWFGLEDAGAPDHVTPLESQMEDAGEVWPRIVSKHALQDHSAVKLASWWHTDADLGREIECFNDMRNSRQAGFCSHQNSARSFFEVFEALVKNRVIPAPIGKEIT